MEKEAPIDRVSVDGRFLYEPAVRFLYIFAGFPIRSGHRIPGDWEQESMKYENMVRAEFLDRPNMIRTVLSRFFMRAFCLQFFQLYVSLYHV